MGSSRKPGPRELGLIGGGLLAGPRNAITDVAGVRVGHATLIEGEGALRRGEGPIRTGVTIILPHAGNLYSEKVTAAVHTINGFGKATGFEQVRELGVIEAPIALTGTLNVGLVWDALVGYSIERNPEIGVSGGSVSIVVGECNDALLNDAQGRHVRAGHVRAAIDAALAASDGGVIEGSVGGGTGTACYGWKGGIGTASRALSAEAGGYTVAALVQTNCGRPEDLTIYGFPAGRHFRPPAAPAKPPRDGGSLMIVLATDAPLTAGQLRRLCVRAEAGAARTGTVHDHSSGDFVIAFTTARRVEENPAALTAQWTVLVDERKAMVWFFRAVADCVEEAMLNALFRGETMTGRDGNVRHAFPVEEAVEMMRRAF